MEFINVSKVASISKSIQRMIKIVDLTKSQYPYLPLTFSVWRKQKFQQLIAQQENQKSPQTLKYLTNQFREEVDKKLLIFFMAKVKQGIRNSFKALRIPTADKLKEFQESNQYQSLITQYIQAATGQLYRLQIMSDLLSLPYGINIQFSYYLRSQYFISDQSNNVGMVNKLIDNHGKTVVSKGLSALGKQLWGKIAFIIGGMNVVGFAGGVAITQAVNFVFSKIGKKKRISYLEDEIKRFNSNSNQLQTCIRNCNEYIDLYLSSNDETTKKQIQACYLKEIQKIFVVDSDDTIIVSDMDKGWKFVQVKEEDEEFEIIQEDKKVDEEPEAQEKLQ